MNIRKIINKHLAGIGSHVTGYSELPLIGKIDDPEGFLDDVCNTTDVSKMIKVHITVPACSCSLFEHTISHINKIMMKRGYVVDVVVEI